MARVAWEFTDDVGGFPTAAYDVLAAEPERFTIALSVLESVRRGLRWSDAPMHFGWHGGSTADAIDGVVLMTPPFPLVISLLPQDDVDELAEELVRRDAPVTAVNGERDHADAFAGAWSLRTSAIASMSIEERLYRLTALRPVSPLPPGGAHRATEDEFELVHTWQQEFTAEALPDEPATDHTEVIRQRIASGLIWLWSVGSQPVALAGRTAIAAGVARVGPVYTPRDNRGNGFGSAVTAACTRDALDAGATGVVLFTDLANPTSNAIYQQLGYEPVVDRVVIRFST